MRFIQALIIFAVIYFCAYALIDRVCKCIEHCATARAYARFRENGMSVKLDDVEAGIKKKHRGEGEIIVMKIINGKYPVIGTKPQEYIPYEVLIPHEQRAIYNHAQTLQRLAERGGLSWYEILCILEDVNNINNIDNKDCKRRVWKYVLKFYNYQYHI